MTNGAASIGVTYDGTDCQDSDPGLFLEITRGINETIEVRGIDVVVPGLAGQIPRLRIGDSLRIVLSGFVAGAGMDLAAQKADFRSTMLAVRTLFDPTKEPAELALVLEDGSTATISARPLNIVVNDKVQSLFAYVSVELLSVAPDWTITPGGS